MEEMKWEKDDIEMHIKQHYLGGCYTSIGRENDALSHGKTLLDEIPGWKSGCVGSDTSGFL
jgi:hypothetical protein